MGPIEIILIAIGLALDAFAISLSLGTLGPPGGFRAALRLSSHFGLFQFLMPIIGWFVGLNIAPLIYTFDHWVAFILLSFVGGRMIYQSFNKSKKILKDDPSKGFSLILLSLATSMDALVIGLSLAMLNLDIWYPAVIIGLITAFLSLIGIRIGKVLGKKYGKIMEIFGGTILLGIGLKILLSDLIW